MKISELVDTKSNKPKKIKKGLSFKKISIQPGFVVWICFLAVVVLELLAIYQYLYPNLIFKGSDRLPSAIRLDIDSYNAVTKRLDAVANYSASSTIQIIGQEGLTGRANPFAEP